MNSARSLQAERTQRVGGRPVEIDIDLVKRMLNQVNPATGRSYSAKQIAELNGWSPSGVSRALARDRERGGVGTSSRYGVYAGRFPWKIPRDMQHHYLYETLVLWVKRHLDDEDLGDAQLGQLARFEEYMGRRRQGAELGLVIWFDEDTQEWVLRPRTPDDDRVYVER